MFFRKRYMSKGSAIVGFLLCFLGGMALMWGIDRSGMGGAEAVADGSVVSAEGTWAQGGPVPVSSKDPSWGSKNAPVTIVEYSDFQ